MTMNLNFRRIFGTASAMAVLMGTGAAGRGRTRERAIGTALAACSGRNGPDCDGVRSQRHVQGQRFSPAADHGCQRHPDGRPVVSEPAPGDGLIFDDHTILVIFPDVSAWFRGTLVAPGTILWSNNTIWQKLPYRA